MKIKPLFILSVSLILLLSCKKDRDYIIYHSFEDQSWKRFNILRFELPLENTKGEYDVSFFAYVTRDYEYDFLDFNMIMTTPSGEERINEYHMVIKGKDGLFTGKFTGDSCEYSVFLKKGISLTRGKLIIEIENLVPRLETKAVKRAGIRLHKL